MDVREVPVESIRVSDLNTRKDLAAGTEDSSIEDLASSIAEKGLLSPILVRTRSDGSYDLIAGQRRLLACQKLGWTKIPAIIRDELDDADATAVSLIENVHRAEMNPIDKARAIKQLHDRYGRDVQRLARETALSEPTLRKYLKLLALPAVLQERVSTADGPAKIDALAALASSFKTEADMVQAYDRIAGFTQAIQKEIIKRSGGDVERVNELALEAQEGAFDTHVCRTPDDCYFIGELPDELRTFVKRVLAGEVEDSEASLRDVIRGWRKSKL